MSKLFYLENLAGYRPKVKAVFVCTHTPAKAASLINTKLYEMGLRPMVKAEDVKVISATYNNVVVME